MNLNNDYDFDNAVAKVAAILQLRDGDDLNARLTQAVLEQFEMDESVSEMIDTARMCQDIANHGIAGGFHGFIYTKDTCEFWDKNKADIMDIVSLTSKEYGDENELKFIENFNGFKELEFKNLTLKDINILYAYNGTSDGENLSFKEEQELKSYFAENTNQDPSEYDRLKNLLSWYAAETVAYNIAELSNDQDSIKSQYLDEAEKMVKAYKKELDEKEKQENSVKVRKNK